MSQPAASLSWTVNNKPVQVSGISGKYYLPQLLLYLSLCFLRTNQILPYRIFLIITVTYVTLHSWHFDNPGELIILSFQESMVHNNKVIQHAGLGLESSMLELRWCQLRGWESSIKTETLLCNASGHQKNIIIWVVCECWDIKMMKRMFVDHYGQWDLRVTLFWSFSHSSLNPGMIESICVHISPPNE